MVSGHVSGNITAESRLELQSTCDIQGEIRSRRVQLDEGARFNGQVHMDDSGVSRTVKPAQEPSAPRQSPEHKSEAGSQSAAGA